MISEKDLSELLDENGNLKVDQTLAKILNSESQKANKKPKLEIILNKYRVLIESYVVWKSHKEYLDLIQSFVRKKIAGEGFQKKFFELHYQNLNQTNEMCKKIEENLKPIPDFFYTSVSEDFTSAMSNLFFEIDSYDPSHKWEDLDLNDILYNEEQLRLVIQEFYLPILERSCNLESSFFKASDDSKIDLDELIQRSYNLLFSVLGLSILLGLSTFF